MHLSIALRQRIIELVDEQNLNFKQLSKLSNVHYTTLMSFMNGSNKTITINILYQICDGLNYSLFDFFDSSLFDEPVDENEKKTKL